MVCPPCGKQEHSKCTNPATCPCHHRKTMRLPSGYIATVRSDGTVAVLQKGQEG